MTALFKRLRNEHPAFNELGARSHGVWRIVTSQTNAMHSLSVIKNRETAAHSNEDILEDAEAMFGVNAARTVLHCLSSGVRGSSDAIQQATEADRTGCHAGCRPRRLGECLPTQANRRARR